MEKKGQVAIFVIIAILIIALIAVFFIFRGELGIGESSLNIDSIRTEIVSCLDNTVEEGVIYIGAHGGYYNIPSNVSRDYFGEKISYYYLNSEKQIPSINKIQKELGNYIGTYFENCVNLSSFEETGYTIKRGNASASVLIHEGLISVDLTYPLVVSKGEGSTRLTKFSSEANTNLETLYIASGELVDSYSTNPGLVCMGCLEEISNKYNIEIKATPIDEGIIWFSLLDPESELKWKFIVGQ